MKLLLDLHRGPVTMQAVCNAPRWVRLIVLTLRRRGILRYSDTRDYIEHTALS